MIRIYDNGGDTYDRYTVIFLDRPESRPGSYEALGMSEDPFDPLGFGQHCVAQDGPHLGRRIELEELPVKCQKLVRMNLAVNDLFSC